MVSSLLGFLKMQLVPLNHGKRCVDIGCNEGLVSLSIAVNFRPASMLGIDIDIREHNRAAIEAHPMASRIQMIQGSSIAPEIIEQVRSVAANYSRVLVYLDSNHTHDRNHNHHRPPPQRPLRLCHHDFSDRHDTTGYFVERYHLRQ